MLERQSLINPISFDFRCKSVIRTRGPFAFVNNRQSLMEIHGTNRLNPLMTCLTNYQIQNPHQNGNNASLYYYPVCVMLGRGMLLQLRTVCVSHATSVTRDSLLTFILYITVKFLGPDDQWVVSGSDDGNFLCGRRITLSLRGFTKATAVQLMRGIRIFHWLR